MELNRGEIAGLIEWADDIPVGCYIVGRFGGRDD